MSANKKLEVLLIQLPAPEYAFKKRWGNVPLAAGYLKAMAYKEGLLDEADIEILDEANTNLSSDSGLIDLIISKSPDVLGFSLYIWNSLRSMFIAEEVKKTLPNVKVIVGGPEVTSETQYILDNPVVDIGCIGEGEIAFVGIMRNILDGKRHLEDVRDIFYRESEQVVFTPASEPISDLDQIPSPFLLGFINPNDYSTVSFETVRGCTSKCAYCATGLIPMRYFSAERIGRELQVILDSGPKTVRLVDSSFALHPNLEQICGKIMEINKESKLRFAFFAHAEHIDRKKADLFKECNVRTVEIGLQSIKPETLRNIHRPPLDKEKFISCVRLLEERDIRCIVDVIIGLPGDNIQDLRNTARFLSDNNVKDIEPFVLIVLPSTRLSRKASTYGIKHQSKPPYILTETPYISREEINEAIRLFKGNRKPGIERSKPSTFISYCRLPGPESQADEETIAFSRLAHLSSRINKIIIEVNRSRQTTSQLGKLGGSLSRKLCQPFTVVLKSENVEADLPLIESLLLPIAHSNPFLLWDIVLETTSHFSLDTIERLTRSIKTEEKILTGSCHVSTARKICAVLPWCNSHKREQKWLSSLGEAIPFYWSFSVPGEFDWQNEICHVFGERYCSGILVDFDRELSLEFIIEALKSFDKYNKPGSQSKAIFLRNLALNYLQSVMRTDNPGGFPIMKPDHIECILSIDRNVDISFALKPDYEVAVGLVAYQMRLQKSLKDQNAFQARPRARNMMPSQLSLEKSR